MKNKRSTPGIRLALYASLSSITLLAACGGGGSDSTSSSTSSPATSAASSMGGTVAIGTALAGATVTVIDANGKTATGTSNSDGSYTVSVQGLTAPFLLEAQDPSGASNPLYSVVANANTAGGVSLIANVTPLTTAVAALMTSSGNPSDLAKSPSSITSSAISTAESTLNQAIAPILKANSVAANLDPISTTFTANQTGLDAVIDSISVTGSTKGTGLQITSLADPDTAIQLNNSTSASATLAAPSQPANYLASLLASMSQCVTDVQGGASITSDAACTTAIDAKYMDVGQTNFGSRHPALLAAGSKLTGIKTLAMLPAGTIPNTSGPVALVYFLFTQANGTSNFASDFVQQTANGWDVIGDQDQFPLYIASFVGRLQHTDSADVANDRYESGLRILIPKTLNVPDASLGTSDTVVGSALVKGPGLPSGGAWMTWAVGSYLVFPGTTMTGPYVDPGCTTLSNGGQACSWSTSPLTTSSEYKLAWTPVSGSGSVSVPSTTDYASQSTDVSSVQQYGAYTVQIYDVKGNAVGTPQTVINVAALQAPQAGQQFAWQTLGSDVVSNFLTAGGSQAGAQTTPFSLTLDWTESATQPIAPTTVMTGEIIPNSGFSNLPNTAIAYDAIGNVSNVTQNGSSYSTTLQTSTQAALSTDTRRLVSLLEQVGGDYYINTWQYGN